MVDTLFRHRRICSISRDLNALLPNTKLTIDLIRNFRRAGKVKDPVKESPLKGERIFICARIYLKQRNSQKLTRRKLESARKLAT